MDTFKTTRGAEFSTLRIVGPEENKVTTLTAYTLLYRGCATQWPSLHFSNSERNCRWSSGQARVLYLKGSRRESSDPPSGLHFLGSMISSGHAKWRGPLKIHGNFDYIPGYWEWTEDVLYRCGTLADAFLTETVQASLCVYDCLDELLKFFCEHWCPSTNTLIIPKGELSISLWDLLNLGGLSVTGRLFDEVVPMAECLSQSLSEEARLPTSCRFLPSSYHYLAVQSPDGRVSTFAWISFWNHSIWSYMGHEAAD
ncbi:hypothetical protein LIER_02531 [Lithospermum erythrorhizon]|uniref:Aminotransferase-like plant mobile domain-containing protein n=1 Tax=Lithospermum erythrorhizon TaxID=34254 RepID=A0AAV3NR81_LITER